MSQLCSSLQDNATSHLQASKGTFPPCGLQDPGCPGFSDSRFPAFFFLAAVLSFLALTLSLRSTESHSISCLPVLPSLLLSVPTRMALILKEITQPKPLFVPPLIPSNYYLFLLGLLLLDDELQSKGTGLSYLPLSPSTAQYTVLTSTHRGLGHSSAGRA